jgi:hypothetical protein
MQNLRARWARFLVFPFEWLSSQNLLAVYFLINSIGLIVFSMLVADWLGRLVQPSVGIYENMYPWARPPANAVFKLTSLLQYVLPVLALFIHYAVFLRVSRFFTDHSISLDRLPKTGFYFLAAIISNGFLFVMGNEQNVRLEILWSVFWFFLLIWTPVSIFRSRPLVISMPTWFWGAVLSVISIQYAMVFVPLITQPMMIENDYINIPEKTILKSGKAVDNLDYINAHQIAGFYLRDPRISNGDNLPARPVSNLDLSKIELNIPAKIYTQEESDFIKRNSIELPNQTKAGWFFYHHGYSFGPMNALSLGASAYDQTMVYGWLSTVVQGKVLSLLNMLNYQGYFKLYFAAYLFYFGMFLLGIWAIFRRLGTVVFAAMLAAYALFSLGIELIRLAPGFNPLRHIFDVLTFYLLYRYLAQDRKSYLLLACALALFSILWNKDFGLFLTLSVGGAVLFNGIRQRPFALLPLFAGGITVVAGLILYVYPLPGANPTAAYMLLGVGSPQAASGTIFGFLIIISLLLAATIRIKLNTAYTVLAVGMALYFVQSLTYYIWYPVPHHLFGVAPVFILWLTLLFHGWFSRNQNQGVTKHESIVLLILLLLFYIPASAHFYKKQWTYNRIFKEHQLYRWTFDKASFISTMDPALFEEAANLIKRYSPKGNGIFIVSKYDHILPILAGKYSAMPYNELLTNLVTPKEVETASAAILNYKPDVLFVDSDVSRNFYGEIPLNNDPVAMQLGLYGEAKSRVMVLYGLNRVYAQIADKYVLCEPGKLISVYCRKPD